MMSPVLQAAFRAYFAGEAFGQFLTVFNFSYLVHPSSSLDTLYTILDRDLAYP